MLEILAVDNHPSLSRADQLARVSVCAQSPQGEAYEVFVVHKLHRFLSQHISFTESGEANRFVLQRPAAILELSDELSQRSLHLLLSISQVTCLAFLVFGSGCADAGALSFNL